MVVVAEVSRAMIVPTGRCVYQPSRIELPHDICQAELGIVRIYDLTPAFVVDDLYERSVLCFYKPAELIAHPDNDTRIVPMLRNEHFELSLKLGLLGRIR